MASEAQRKTHDMIRDLTHARILERASRATTSAPFNVQQRLAEGQHPRDILRDLESHRAPVSAAIIHVDAPAPPHVSPPVAKKVTKSQKIPKKIRTLVWNEYIGGMVGMSKCLCCDSTVIDKADFHCGHIIASANGGTNSVENLRPICPGCNGAMGTQNMELYCMNFFGRGIIKKKLEAVNKNYSVSESLSKSLCSMKSFQ
jgi:5-methylcytosine-specific restriction endonuclease McrA